ncbi:MAG: ThiF family adenylyltransferase, partial [Candidatus Vogelbacteria bacterium]|nr:ThiF family adenylyltransferase [Candidatus Vogelbacteria bacterium]
MDSKLKALLKTSVRTNSPDNKPIIFNLANQTEQETVATLFAESKIETVIDNYGEQSGELALVNDPTLITKAKENASVSNNEDDPTKGVWIYFPWRETLVHSLNKDDYEKLRLSRNDNLLSKDQQNKLMNLRIGLAGLNVGNPGAISLAQEGVQKLKMADLDILSLSNLNRFRAGLPDVELDKTTITVRQVYEVNPYADLELYNKGIQPDNIDKFLLEPKIDLLIEEVDNLKLKIAMRERAREHKIPVLMVTGNGHNIIIDIERNDLDNSGPILNGYLKPEVIERIGQVGPTTDLREKMALARDFMGGEILVKELRESFDRVGIDLAGIPQLAEATFLRGATLAYFTRRICVDKD